MNTNILALASGLSDHDLLARIGVLASREREATAELVAHLAELDVRPALYAAQSYGSLFGYCTKILRLSEDAACNRIEAARACRSFPLIVDLLTSGAMSLTSVRLLRKHLTTENRYTPRHVKRAVWQRDDGQCAFVSPDGVRCRERTFLEFHHVPAYARGGPATVENISLRCRRHNQYEAELFFGARAIHPGRPTQPTAAARGATAATDV